MIAFCRRHVALFALLLLAVLPTGCSKPVGTVKGKISVNGKPLPAGLITFESEVGNNDPYSAAIREGEYETGPIPVGSCKITVIQATVAKPSGGGDQMPPKAGRAADPLAVPAKYGKSDTSGLSFAVKAGSNTFDKDLTP